tara:strand:+ start:528 stop:860 length:333 start_codon:yes stop_codon:yes gene_type:complete
MSSDDDYEAEYKFIKERFGDNNFNICLPMRELKDKLTDEDQIIIKQDFKCYCYGDNPPINKYFLIKNKEMTNENIIDDLIKQGLTAECNHSFLECISKQTTSQFSLGFGS